MTMPIWSGHSPSAMRLASPGVVICHTVKGKGVSFMENSVLWHYRNAQGDEYAAAESGTCAAVGRKRRCAMLSSANSTRQAAADPSSDADHGRSWLWRFDQVCRGFSGSVHQCRRGRAEHDRRWRAGWRWKGTGSSPIRSPISPTLRCLEQIRNDICYHDAERQHCRGRRRVFLWAARRVAFCHRGLSDLADAAEHDGAGSD